MKGKSLWVFVGVLVGVMGLGLFSLAEDVVTEKEDLKIIADDAEVKEDVFDPGSWGLNRGQGQGQGKLDGKGDNGVFDPGAWGVNKDDIAEGDAWDYQNNPNRMNNRNIEVLEPGRLKSKSRIEGVSGSGQAEEPPMETIEGKVQTKKMRVQERHAMRVSGSETQKDMMRKKAHGRRYGQGVAKMGTGNIGNPPQAPTTPGKGSGSGSKGGKGTKRSKVPKSKRNQK